MKATISRAPISYKKLNVIASAIRKQKVTDALSLLKFMPKKGARVLYTLLHSAMSNAEKNDGQKRENLIIESIVVNKGVVLHRSVPVSRGRAHPIRKQASSVAIRLAVGEGMKAEKAATKKTTEKKAPAKKTVAKAVKAKTPTKKTTKTSKSSKSE